MRDSFCRCRSFLSAVVQSAAVEPPPLSSALLRLSQKHSARQGAQQCSNALTCTEKTTKRLKGCVRQSKKLALNRKSMETEKDDYKILFLLNDLVKGICIALVPTTHNLMTTQGTLHPRPRLSTLQTLNGCFPYP